MTITTTVTGDQAIFTSIRTPMGEGYRIIAAGKGLRPEEKQAITRNSPSHDSVSAAPSSTGGDAPSNEPAAFAFYPLPGGRLCAAYSRQAGAEHTGRGGQRIYTYNVVFTADQFANCAFNPFHILRAMLENGLTQPQLTPPPVLPDLNLEVRWDWAWLPDGAWRSVLSPPVRKYLLHGLLCDKSFLLDLSSDWFAAAEALLLGMPGPLRAKLSFCAGLKYSAGRNYRLHLLHDATGTARNRTAGQKIEYVDAKTTPPAMARTGAWIDWVERTWETADLAGLARRTSLPFKNCGPDGRDRVARWYRGVDEAAQTETAKLLTHVGESLTPVHDEAEQAIIADFHSAAQSCLAERYRSQSWTEVAPFWPATVNLWRKSAAGAKLALPLLDAALHSAVRDDPPAAAKAALLIARDVPAHARLPEHTALLDAFWTHMATWAEHAALPADFPKLRPLLSEWYTLRPACMYLRRTRDCLSRVCPPAGPAVASR